MTATNIISPDGSSFEVRLDGPCTLDRLRAEIPLAPGSLYPLFFHSGSTLTRTSEISGENLSLTCISLSDFPEKSFPASDYSVDLDRLRFEDHKPADDFPDSEAPPFLRGNQPERVESVPGSTHPFTFLPGLGRESNPRSPRRSYRISMSEEEDGEDPVDPGYGRIDAVLEERDNFQEALSPHDEEVVRSLAQLGFDRAIVTPLLFIADGDESTTRGLLDAALASMNS
jgi:hypothetical protein